MIRYIDLDLLARDPEPPEWVVDDLIARQNIAILSGDTGSAKSMIAQALALAVIRGDEWLGHKVQTGRVLYIDEENSLHEVLRRLRALGLSGPDSGLKYSEQQSLRFGVGEDISDNGALRQAVAEHRPDLVVIDTTSMTSGFDLNDNGSVLRYFSETLRPIVNNHGCAILLVHHERKSQHGYRDASQSAMGARAWIGQVDVHFASEPKGKEIEDDGEDGLLKTYRYLVRVPKRRNGGPIDPIGVQVCSLEHGSTLDWLRVDASEIQGSPKPSLAREIAQMVAKAGRPLMRSEIAQGLDLDTKSGRLEQGLKEAIATGLIIKAGYGKYGPKQA